MNKYKNSILNFYTSTYGVGKSLGIRMCYFIDVAPFKAARKIAEFKRDKGFDYLKKIKYETGFLLKNKQFLNLKYLSSFFNNLSIIFFFFLPL